MKTKRPKLIEDRDGFTREETREEFARRKMYWSGGITGVLLTAFFFWGTPGLGKLLLAWFLAYLLVMLAVTSVMERLP
jgi:cation transporter-like permease